MATISHKAATQRACEKIRNRFPQIEMREFRADITLTVPREQLVEVMRYVKEACGFDMLLNVAAVDHLGQDVRFEVHYAVSQAETGANLLIRTPLTEQDPSLPSLVELWRSANWLEREQYDLMGIRFEGHPDLRRIMMWEDYPYHPLRKDFPVAGVPTETPGVAFTEKAPTDGAPFTTTPGGRTAADREPRSRG